jgi:hypothetical protein
MNKLKTMLITPDAELASYAELCGVDRIFLDLEILGKEDRQKNHNLPLNNHTFEDVKKVKAKLKHADVMVRINPPNKNTEDEVSQAINSGADCIMLPYFFSVSEVEMFLKKVNGQCKTNLLLETATATARAEQILSLGFDEVHLGLNDLKLTFKLNFLYETVSGGLVDYLAHVSHKNKKSFGFGGVGSVTKSSDLAPEMIIKEHARLGSERVILSRAFTGTHQTVNELTKHINLEKEISLIQAVYNKALDRSPEEIQQDRLLFNSQVEKVAKRLGS